MTEHGIDRDLNRHRLLIVGQRNRAQPRRQVRYRQSSWHGLPEIEVSLIRNYRSRRYGQRTTSANRDAVASRRAAYRLGQPVRDEYPSEDLRECCARIAD